MDENWYAPFRNSKKDLDAQIAELFAEVEKGQPQFADDVVDRADVLRQIQKALDTLDIKLQALERHGIASLSDEDKMQVMNAMTGVRQLLALRNKLSREEVPTDGSLARHVLGQRKEPYDWNE